jgi:biopolymer transport protein ExbD
MKIARRTLKVEVPTVAMGDIAFNLLVFFFILANANDDSNLKWTRARTPAKIEEVGAARVRVTVDEDYKVYVNGRQVSTAQVQAAVEELLGEAPAGQRTVLLKIHKDAQASLFEPIIEGVSQAGGELVHVLEEEKP